MRCEGYHYFAFVVFSIFVVNCCLHVIGFFFFLHGGGGAWHWFDENLALCGVSYGGSANMAIYEQVRSWWKIKFRNLRKVLCYLIFFCLWFSKSWSFEMVVFRQLKFVREECPKIQEVFWIEGTVIPLCHFPLFCVGWRMLYKVWNIWRRWWTDKGFQEWLDCGICDGKERWCIFGTEYWFGV